MESLRYPNVPPHKVLIIAVLGIATGPQLLIDALLFRVIAESAPPGGGWTL